jgi:uncharacterized repeat protein (TIGR02543 family)
MLASSLAWIPNVIGLTITNEPLSSGTEMAPYGAILEAGQNPALVEVTSDPSGAAIYLDFQATAKVTPAILDVGEIGTWDQLGNRMASHVITLKKAGRPHPVPQVAPAREAERVGVHFDMTASASGSLSIATTPAGATVFVDYADASAGISPVVVGNLAPGSHVILLKKTGYLQPRPIVAWVQEGFTNAVSVPLMTNTAPARLMVDARSVPPGATVYVDYLPATNVTDVVVDWMDPASHAGSGWQSGSHTIMLRKSGYLPLAPRYVTDRTNEMQAILVPMTLASSSISILTDRTTIQVPEGGTASFQVKLSSSPTGVTVVAVARTSGDTNITVSGGSSRTFTTANWDSYQTVTLAASEDNSDNANGTAVIACMGIGLHNATVAAAEIDDDYALAVTAANGTVDKSPNKALYDKGSTVSLTASASTGYHFTGWTGDVTGTNNPVSVTMNRAKSATAHFVLNVITVRTDRATVSVPEGGSANFQVKLSAQPTGNTVVTVARASGDSDITVSGGASLTFSTANWGSYQTVTLAAAEDNGENLNGSAAITCSASGATAALVNAVEADDDFTLAVTSLYGDVSPNPDATYYDNGTVVILTATANSYCSFKNWTGDLAGTNNPASLTMNGNKSVTANYNLVLPGVLPPRAIGKKSFTARWKWVEDASPEGEFSVALNAAFTQFAPGYETRYVNNVTDCLVTNLISNRDYWYRIRRFLPDGDVSPWSSSMKVRTGKRMPVFKKLLSDVPVSKGISQQFSLSALASGGGTLTVKSSNANAVKAVVSEGVVTLQYLWKETTPAKVTLTLTHPATGYKQTYGATLSRASGSVAVVGRSSLTNAGIYVAQEVTLENRTSRMVYGIRLRALGLDQAAWLINRTGLDPVSGAAIREIPCVLPADSQMVMRVVYNAAYKKQAKTRPVTYGAWAIMTPVNGAPPVNTEMTITRQEPYDGLWLLGMPADRNRLYKVYQSDDDGANWTLNVPTIRATANYLMWLDTDEGAPANRLYRVVDSGI